jgi:acyl-CoA synthetase (AMP-forming)/AMP-acid ligase II
MDVDFEQRLAEFEQLSAGGAEEGRIAFTSSGSTGERKTCRLPMSRLREFIGDGPEFKGLRWATCFDPSGFAGTVVALQAWANGGTVMHLPAGDFRKAWDRLFECGIDALSLTPSFLRLMLVHRPVGVGEKGIPVIRLTLGGEVVSGDLVEQARRLWPDCAVRVIYASAEAGVVFRSRDFRGVYRSEDLVSPWRRYEVRDGELVLESDANPVQWVHTGDLAEVDDASGGIRLVGRKSRVVNVGGQKFSLDAIERVVESVEGVEVARCRAVANPVVGNVVACAWEGLASEADIIKKCQAQLPKPAWPRVWEPGQVQLSPSGKK